ncbi:Putative RING-H2 finger protein ATL71 [Morus notabilis]|uniref:Putative RING-H2 finger protein ATL71 n=1 Tax=Morus notabilis TaxID=981085 RepID=W9QVU6_9ROSA|nr:putative RING-H2 finger protein ATL71 [Morus notabilis]EXB39584.1 Putative RING-H2 finger protein ATL71 [Morus notabilis]
MSFANDDRGTTGKVLMAIQISLVAIVILVDGFNEKLVPPLLFAVFVAYYCTARTRTHALLRSDNSLPRPAGDSISTIAIVGAGSSAGDQDSGGVTIIELGLDEAALRSFPKLLYSVDFGKLVDHEDEESSSSTAICCSICLADFEEGDVLWLLPDCGHVFHQKCVDPWLQLRPTCPNCRTSPIPTPIATPLAEVTPSVWQ